MKKYCLIILSTFVTGIILLDFGMGNSNVFAQQNVDRHVIPLLIPPYQMIGDLPSFDLKKFNVTFINDDSKIK